MSGSLFNGRTLRLEFLMCENSFLSVSVFIGSTRRLAPFKECLVLFIDNSDFNKGVYELVYLIYI